MFVTEVNLLVVDPSHPRFGQLAELGAYDWKESGTLLAKFPDGTVEQFYDGGGEQDPHPPQAMRIKAAETGLVARILGKLPDVWHKLATLAAVAMNEELPLDLRLHAKKLFSEKLNSL